MKIIFNSLIISILAVISANAQIVNPADAAKNGATNRTNNEIYNGVDKGLNAVEQGIGGLFKKKPKEEPKDKNQNSQTQNSQNQNQQNKNPQTQNEQSKNNSSQTAANSSQKDSTKQSLKAYANYDFVAGQKIIFDDNFKDDQDGEFASHWDLINGQAVLNKFNGDLVMKITDGNYGSVVPLMKEKNYLPKDFTLEFDHYQLEGANRISFWFKDADNQEVMTGYVSNGGATMAFMTDAEQRSLEGTFPEELLNENYYNRWHHVAMVVKGKNIKIYVDQFRVLNVPNNTAVPTKVFFGGIGNSETPVIFKNVKIAEGGGMNVVGKAFTDGKYISHGIRFDVNKATIKPESMGEINGIVQILKDNPTLKFEIGGHTDADGDDASNLKLSQNRADAVKNQLVSLGIDAARLTSKGYGETKLLNRCKNGVKCSEEEHLKNRRTEFRIISGPDSIEISEQKPVGN